MEDNKEHSKEPWLAVTLSFLLVGAGQIYSGHVLRGCILIVTELTFGSLEIWALLSSEHDVLAAVCIGLGAIVVRIWNLFDAHRCARTANSDRFEADRKQIKDAWLALFLADLIPGLGQIYLKKWVWGALFVAVSVSLLAIGMKYRLLSYSLWAVFSAAVCYHAYVSAPSRRERSNNTISIVVALILCSCLFGVGVGYAFQRYVVEAFQIPPSLSEKLGMPGGGSMKPTLIAGDRVLVRKSKKYVPSRCDIVTFKSPDDPGIPWIMRVAALPGETVEIANGMLLINGQKVQYRTIHRINITADQSTGRPHLRFG
jgi:signal peptidase I